MTYKAMSELKSGISVVIPVFNSATILPELVERLAQVLPGLRGNFEVILVNDGSRDQSWRVIEELGAKFKFIRGICLMRNYGQHNALLAGIRAANYATTITMDDDLQHPPEELPHILQSFTDDLDVIYAPPVHEQHGLFRNLSSIVTKLVLKGAMGAATARNVTAWRIFRTQIRTAFENFNAPMASIDVLLTWGTVRFGVVRVPHAPRLHGKSNYSFVKLVRHAFNMLTGFTVIPLQMASLIGFIITIFGVFVLGYVLLNLFFHESSVAGFPFLASIIAIFSGAQLFSIGVIGEYLARMHFRIMDKPVYSIKRSI
jgi:glycosyltransferase involved in cell wall biosynthesis